MTSDPILSKPVVCIMGPTASGKTALAVELAKAIHGEVVSVDSALIYTDMNIGTAKPTEKEKQGIVHHLIDILNPEQSYSVADFIRDASVCIEDILERGKIPILAGGTMMYFNALHHGISEIPAADHDVRAIIAEQITKHGSAWLHQQLQEVDPASADKIHPNDPQRVTRALEVFKSTGKTLSAWKAEKKPMPSYDFFNFALMTEDRALLHSRIEKRFKTMLDAGLIDEVQEIISNYTINPDLPSMRSVGYRQVFEYLAKDIDYDTMVEKGIAATRQLAKRQITWLRGWENTEWLDINEDNNLQRVMQKVCVTRQ
ncbi:tRNA (adenosine(37)-N6)-dimethylallyltransferase MiaA [Glaciecola sp. SC05]|uniref:tRNA (adenosine(37)-N6)-dimethylallyltransferase MiaA n=1 Tax=Glaciecola sp. SC05 TaxID=1987355 RepID=UPI0035299507